MNSSLKRPFLNHLKSSSTPLSSFKPFKSNVEFQTLKRNSFFSTASHTSNHHTYSSHSAIPIFKHNHLKTFNKFSLHHTNNAVDKRFSKIKTFSSFSKKTTTVNYTERQTKALINPFRNGSILSSSNQHLNLKSSLSLLNTNNNAAAVLIQKRNLSQEAKVAIACGSALLVYAIGPLQLFSSFVTVSAYLSLGIVLTSGALLFMIRSANMTARNRPSHMRWVLLGGAIVTLIFFNPATIAKAGAYISLFCLLASATVLGVIVHRNRSDQPMIF